MSNAGKNHVNGFILAGGNSSRMGKDKGLLQLKGKAMVKYVIDQLQPAVDTVVIVANNPQYEIFGLEVIRDIINDMGPAGGIYTALKHANSNRNFIVSCDMPFIHSDAVNFIIHISTQAQIILPEHKNQTEPLFGIYTKECLPLWEGLLQQEIIKLQELISHFALLKVNIDNNKLFNEMFFSNVNTKKDFEDALQRLKNGK